MKVQKGKSIFSLKWGRKESLCAHVRIGSKRVYLAFIFAKW